MKDKPTRVALGPKLKIRRLITGLWQMADQERADLAGDGPRFDRERAAEALLAYARAGFDSFDMADHYGSAEIVAGMVHKTMREAGETPPVILTKWCPAPAEMDAGTVRQGVERALARLGLDHVDVMQFHWWRYEDPRYLDALAHLMRLREEGLIGAIGLTNFDAAHLRMLLKNGIEIASNQVCFSLLDRRAADALFDVARTHDVALLAFGSLCGGFLSDRWLGAEEPMHIPDWSRQKYKRFIDQGGGWARFQSLLSVLSEIAGKHGVSVSNVATAWVLGHAEISAAIIGVRLGETQHRADNLRALDLTLDDDDRRDIDAAIGSLNAIPGDCGDEYRRPPFLTASGDLSHHLASLPAIYPVRPVGERTDRSLVETGSIWEEKAGFARATRIGRRILVSGTTATTPAGAPVCPDDAAGQAVYILDKIAAAVEALGGSLGDVVRTRIYLRHASAWEGVSAVHARYFGGVRPANTLIGGIELVGPYEVEIEAEAEIDGDWPGG
ncbi:MAG: aldo/keto reductase [Pseudomonadota bacterium]